MGTPCVSCKSNEGFRLLNSHGCDGDYYALTCKICGWHNNSEIMGQCNQSHLLSHNNHIAKSSDNRYWVYSEEYIRYITREGR